MMWGAVVGGLVAGTVSGMGIGGGTVLIPVLLFLLRLDQPTAQGVNLLFFVPTAVVALAVHIRNRSVAFRAAIPTILFGVVGAVAGASLATVLSGDILRRLFGGFLCVMGLYEMVKGGPKNLLIFGDEEEAVGKAKLSCECTEASKKTDSDERIES